MLALGLALFFCAAGDAALAETAQAKQSSSSDSVILFWDVDSTAAGDALRGGNVTVAGGKIALVAPGGSSGDNVKVGAITPGMIDLSARIAGWASVEQT